MKYKIINNFLKNIFPKIKLTPNKTIKPIDYLDEKNTRSIVRTLLSGVVLIFCFYLFPIIGSYVEKNSFVTKEFKNKSKQKLDLKLKGIGSKELKKDNDKLIINEGDLFSDIFEMDELPTDTVRLSASTISQLFKETNYDLKDVREKNL